MNVGTFERALRELSTDTTPQSIMVHTRSGNTYVGESDHTPGRLTVVLIETHKDAPKSTPKTRSIHVEIDAIEAIELDL